MLSLRTLVLGVVVAALLAAFVVDVADAAKSVKAAKAKAKAKAKATTKATATTTAKKSARSSKLPSHPPRTHSEAAKKREAVDPFHVAKTTPGAKYLTRCYDSCFASLSHMHFFEGTPVVDLAPQVAILRSELSDLRKFPSMCPGHRSTSEQRRPKKQTNNKHRRHAHYEQDADADADADADVEADEADEAAAPTTMTTTTRAEYAQQADAADNAETMAKRSLMWKDPNPHYEGECSDSSAFHAVAKARELELKSRKEAAKAGYAAQLLDESMGNCVFDCVMQSRGVRVPTIHEIRSL